MRQKTKLLKAILYAPISIVMTLLAWVIAPVLPLATVYRETQYSEGKKVPVLWGPLYLLMTHDTDLDAGHRRGHYWSIDTSSKWQVYWSRVRWIWRNPIYGFQHYVLGCWVGEFTTYYNQDEVTDIRQVDGHFCKRDKFTFCGIRFKYKFGWKLFRHDKPEDIWKGWPRAMYVCSLMLDK